MGQKESVVLVGHNNSFTLEKFFGNKYTLRPRGGSIKNNPDYDFSSCEVENSIVNIGSELLSGLYGHFRYKTTIAEIFLKKDSSSYYSIFVRGEEWNLLGQFVITHPEG